MAETIYYVDPDVSGGAGDGSTWANAYSSLNAAETAQDGNITAGNAVVFVCGHNGASQTTADTAAVNVFGWTTDADSYVAIRTETADRHTGLWSDAKYRLTIADSKALQISEDYVRVEGLQVAVTHTSAANQSALYVSAQATSDIRINDTLVKHAADNTNAQQGIYLSGGIATVWNCAAYGLGTTALFTNGAMVVTGTMTVYSSTLIGGYAGLRVTTGSTCTAKNVYARGGTVSFSNAGTLTATYCASSDLTADDFGATGCVVSVAFDTDTFVNVTAGSVDLHLAADGLSPLMGAGIDTSGESAPLNFTTDFDGQTRDATWDIGADAWVIAGRTTKNTRAWPLGIEVGMGWRL